MTYFGFLLLFLGIPIFLMSGYILASRGSVHSGFPSASPRRIVLAIGVQIVLAVLYTTPWDNYLVATGVWTYSPALVSGIILGYVPLEEYVFFVLEALLVGLWWWALASRKRASTRFWPRPRLRVGFSSAAGLLWLASAALLLSGWALPPMLLQLAFGADILWKYRRLVGAVIVPIGLYLSAADALAIRARIWAIDPLQTTGAHIGMLPLEEGLFFFATVTLLTFGLTLFLAPEGASRFEQMLRGFGVRAVRGHST
jgi:lycopene cyclase domain-containing protein